MNEYNCRSCGANLNPGQAQCDYCGAVFHAVIHFDADARLQGLKVIIEHPTFPLLASFFKIKTPYSNSLNQDRALEAIQRLDQCLLEIRGIDRHRFPTIFSGKIGSLVVWWEWLAGYVSQNFLAVVPLLTPDDCAIYFRVLDSIYGEVVNIRLATRNSLDKTFFLERHNAGLLPIEFGVATFRDIHAHSVEGDILNLIYHRLQAAPGQETIDFAERVIQELAEYACRYQKHVKELVRAKSVSIADERIQRILQLSNEEIVTEFRRENDTLFEKIDFQLDQITTENKHVKIGEFLNGIRGRVGGTAKSIAEFNGSQGALESSPPPARESNSGFFFLRLPAWVWISIISGLILYYLWLKYMQ